MLNFFKKIFGASDYAPLVARINALEPSFEKLSPEDLRGKSKEFKDRVLAEGALDDLLPEAFALVREAAVRTLDQRHFDVQLMGGMALHEGKIAEMMTGEGKTLAATAPAYLNALAGRGVHVITVNDYLARRDTVWMGQIYHVLGLTVACLTHEQAFMYDASYTRINVDAESNADQRGSKPEISGNQQTDQRESASMDRERDELGGFKVVQEFLRPISRKEAYAADITYGTNHEFGFDYLRDHLAYRLDDQVQTRFNPRESAPHPHQSAFFYAIIDEVDSILIDEARTPLIIAAPDRESSEYYRVMSRVVRGLVPEEDYVADEKQRTAAITDQGIDKVEKMLRLKDFYGPENFRLVHYLEESLKAKAFFIRDKNYVVKGGEVIIVDEFTGRLMHGRRYSGGLHQAIEAKEGVEIKQESRTYAQITIQNYFRLYEKIAGMTGTAQTSAEEFDKVYKLPVTSIPPNRPCIREDLPDFIYKNTDVKYRAVVADIKERHLAGQPVLVGTASIERNELLSKSLSKAGIPHEVLNAKNHEREGAIIAQAGRPGAVTVATNMAGRGVDIVLGGNPPDPREAERVRELGGLYVIGTDRHEARRIDNQLRGRSGRQGDPGRSRFYLSLEDDLLRIFGGERIKGLMETFNLPEDQPIESGLVTKVVNEAQKKVEGFNFDSRKHLLEYDDILNKQRIAFYKKRQEILEGSQIDADAAEAPINADNKETDTSVNPRSDPRESALQRQKALQLLDVLWMNYLEDVEALRESVGMRAYGQHEPLIEYRRESHLLFKEMLENFDKLRQELQSRIDADQGTDQRGSTAFAPISVNPSSNLRESAPTKVGRNNPCPCGAKYADGRPIKYKHCHGKNV